MHFRRVHTTSRTLVVFVVLWAALAVAAGTLNKADAELGPASSESAIEIALKTCAVIFTALAAAASGAARKLWRLPARCAGIESISPVRFERRYRPPPHGFSLLRRLQVIIV